jgi:diaminopimelate epimerase
VYIDETNIANSVVLLLTHEQMEEEVAACGSATHGTAAANANNQNIEYSITIKVGSPMMAQWIEKYDAPDIRNQIIGG